MIWGKRAFSGAEDFGRYQELLIKLLYEHSACYREFMMVNIKTEHPSSRMYYVGVPTEDFMTGFDGFEYVRDEELPKVIDAVIVADIGSEEFTSRFRYSSQSIVTDAVHSLGGP
jgi:hypothetical protein